VWVFAAIALNACGLRASAQSRVYQSQHHAYRLVSLVEHLEHPWGMAFLPNGDILVTERPGRLRVVRRGVLDPTPVPDMPEVWARGQGGMHDVILHPAFAQNRLVYLSFAKPGLRGATTAVIRGRWDGSRLQDLEEIFVADAWGRRGQHFGGRMVFDREGFLYLSVGERGEMRRAQDPSDHAGTVLRLRDDGRAAPDNPFVGRRGFRPEIFTYGHRNPQGMVVHPETGALWTHEHGPRGGDEVNLERAGRNYGWPAITYGIDYSGRVISDRTAMEGMEQPLLYWDPSIAPSGMAIYTGDAFPNWRGDVFVGALAGQHLRRVRFEGTRPVEQEQLLTELGMRIRDVRNGPDGFIYLLMDEDDAPMVRLEPAGSRSGER
jgi:glucose/arabinose dehydrogenase